MKRSKFSGDDEVQTYSTMKFIPQAFVQLNDISVTKHTESGYQGRQRMLFNKEEDSSGHVTGRNWKNVRNARSVSADEIETTSKLPSIDGINRVGICAVISVMRPLLT